MSNILTQEDKKLLEGLINTYSPSGDEGTICNFIKDNYHDGNATNATVINKQINSITFYLDCGRKKTILLDAHIDEISSRIISITDKGFLIVKVMGTDPVNLNGRPVKVFSSVNNKILQGVYLIDPPHLKKQREKYKDNYNNSLLYVDIGVSTEADAAELVEIGDPIVSDYSFQYLNENIFTGRALDNKLGTFVLMKLLKYFDTCKDKSKYNIIFNFSGKEEVGLAQYLHFSDKEIDSIIVIDTGIATDVPFISEEKYGKKELGKGPVICRGMDSSGLFKVFKTISRAKDIPIQINFPMGGGTNLHYFSRFNTLTQQIGIPIRNIHSPVETCDLNDLNYTFKIIKLFLEKDL